MPGIEGTPTANASAQPPLSSTGPAARLEKFRFSRLRGRDMAEATSEGGMSRW